MHDYPPMSPTDVLAGLGGADRALLATALALFDDSRLHSRIEKRLKAGLDGLQRAWETGNDHSSSEVADQVLTTKEKWRLSTWSDDDLRLLLWIRLRESLDLPPRLTASWRGCGHLANDLTAALINSLDPPGMVKSGKRWLCRHGWLAPGEQATTLPEIVVPILDELLEKALEAEQEAPDRDTRRSRLSQALAALREVSAADRDELLQDTGADNIHNRTVRNALLLGGSLGAFGAGVSCAGFSAYILAAQASAFVPLFTGPGLVSLVSVVSNPVFIIAAAGGGTWHFAKSARGKINANVASHVVTLLTVQGLQTGRPGLERARRSFNRTPRLICSDALSRKEKEAWAKEWEILQPIWVCTLPEPSERIVRGANTIVETDISFNRTSQDGAPLAGDEKANATIFGTLTVGDILYHYYAVDPTTVTAANFSRIADIEGRITFSQLAEDILDGSNQEVLGGINQLKGYVAEKAVASELVAAGHAVSFPENSNEPGFDLLVDGQPFQVKFHATPEGIREHFKKYDQPVFANSEFAEDIPDEWKDQVYFLDGLSNELVTDVTESSLNAGSNLFDSAVVTSVGVIAVGRGVLAYRRGRISGQQAIEQVLLDGTVRVGLAGSGAVVGSAAGFAVFGPAGAWVFGAGGPILAATQTTRVATAITRHTKSEAHQQWEQRTHERIDTLQQTALKALDQKARQLKDKIAAVPEIEGGRYLKWRLADDLRYVRECLMRIASIPSSSQEHPDQRTTELLRWLAVATLHPASYQQEIRALNRLLGERPGLRDLLDQENLSETFGQGKMHVERWTQAATKRARQSSFTDWISRKTKRPRGDDREGPKQ